MRYIKIMLTRLVIATAGLAIVMSRRANSPAIAPVQPVADVLDTPVYRISLESVTYEQAVAALSKNSGVQISIDPSALGRVGSFRGASPGSSFIFGGSTLSVALDDLSHLFEKNGDRLFYHDNGDGKVVISAFEDGRPCTRVYDVRDLLTDQYWGVPSDAGHAQANQSTRLQSLVSFLAARIGANTGCYTPMETRYPVATIYGLAGKLVVVAIPSRQNEIAEVLGWLRRIQ